MLFMLKMTVGLLLLLFIMPIQSTAQKDKKKQANEGIFPEEHKPIKRPVGITNSSKLNEFMSNCYLMYDKTTTTRLALQNIYTQLNAPLDASGSQNMLNQFSLGYRELITIVPVVQDLVTTAPDLISSVKKDLPMIQYLQAAIMFKSALTAAKYSIGDLKYLMTKTVPNMKQLFVSKQIAGADTITIQQVQISDTLALSK